MMNADYTETLMRSTRKRAAATKSVPIKILVLDAARLRRWLRTLKPKRAR